MKRIKTMRRIVARKISKKEDIKGSDYEVNQGLIQKKQQDLIDQAQEIKKTYELYLKMPEFKTKIPLAQLRVQKPSAAAKLVMLSREADKLDEAAKAAANFWGKGGIRDVMAQENRRRTLQIINGILEPVRAFTAPFIRGGKMILEATTVKKRKAKVRRVAARTLFLNR